MPKLRPGLKKMTSGNWQGRIKINGKTLTHSSADRQEVERWLDTQQARRRGHAYGDDPLGERTPVAELWAKYQTKRMKPRTLRRYQSLWSNHLEPKWAAKRACDLKRWMVQDWIDDELAHLAPATVEGCVVLLQGIMRVAVDREWVIVNPVKGVTRPEVARPEVEVPTVDEMFALIDAMPIYLMAVTVFGFACGMRFGECAGVVRSKLDVADYATAHVIVDEQVHPDGTTGDPKSRGAGHYAKRRAPLPEWAVDYLRDYLAWRGPMLPTAYVSVAAKGGPLYGAIFDYHFAKAQETVYGEDRGFTHKTLRHWHISHRQAGGDRESSIQRTVGHRQGSKVTARSYTHTTETAEQHTREVLNAIKARGRRVEG